MPKIETSGVYLAAIYEKIATQLKSFSPPLLIKKEAKGFSLLTGKPVEIGGRKYPELYFAAVLTQTNYVGFYFMPIYMNDSLLAKIPEPLRKCLKGKSCFHIKQDETQLYEHIKQSLDLGFDCFKKLNWI